ncbi:MAG: hypothetical protein HOG03_23475 [Desulfobacula sp.]|uniref:hypothetical protein n=1 Tax=Desulfobacula sp. TaxID=2593537 RepID=UPI001D3DF7C0|nr:hypothetical protein [Desulfobacula sp.]MBT6338418.1 hypothetical protein [Desulfobacula sp.]MBT6751745.1 hypothetical protein [Desulfobacula sp.]
MFAEEYGQLSFPDGRRNPCQFILHFENKYYTMVAIPWQSNPLSIRSGIKNRIKNNFKI